MNVKDDGSSTEEVAEPNPMACPCPASSLSAALEGRKKIEAEIIRCTEEFDKQQLEGTRSVSAEKCGKDTKDSTIEVHITQTGPSRPSTSPPHTYSPLSSHHFTAMCSPKHPHHLLLKTRLLRPKTLLWQFHSTPPPCPPLPSPRVTYWPRCVCLW